MVILEEIIRGHTANHPSHTTKLFAEMYQKKLLHANCLGVNNELRMDKYELALEEERLDLKLLSSALGNQELSKEFLE